jgi:hypothetical protein
MISEKELAEYFHSFWQKHFPLLDPIFVKRFNAEQKERLTSDDGSAMLPVPKGAGIERFDLVSELAFELALEDYKTRSGSGVDHGMAIERALKRISWLKGEPEIPAPNTEELTETQPLLKNYECFFDHIAPEGPVTFRPRIKGVGILNEMEGDLCTKKTLYEVKSVNRNVQGGDLRQVLCYLVAGLGSRQFSWTDYCIFNPRLSVFYKGQVDELLAYLSGRTAPECIADVLDALMEREQPLETRF